MSESVDVEELADALTELLRALLRTLDGLAWAQRHLHPPEVPRLQEALAPLRPPLAAALEGLSGLEWPPERAAEGGHLRAAAEGALEALTAFLGVTQDPAAVYQIYRALRRQTEVLEHLYPLCASLEPISRFFLETGVPSVPQLVTRLAQPAAGEVPVGILHLPDRRRARGGFSLYVPETYEPSRSWPLVVALHGGSGHGADFLWTWVREARSRGVLILSPSSVERTWSLAEPDTDAESIRRAMVTVMEGWNVDLDHVLLTGMSDGATYTLLCGLRPDMPFTHLAPVSGVLAPLAAELQKRVAARPIYLVHGALDWMFPVEIARLAAQELQRLGARLIYREIADLSHTYPREENGPILEWFDPSLAFAG